jgi:hypothetical protein
MLLRNSCCPSDITALPTVQTFKPVAGAAAPAGTRQRADAAQTVIANKACLTSRRRRCCCCHCCCCRDQRCGFSDSIKQQLWEAAAAPRLCGICQQVIHTIGDAEVDHVVPHSLGGLTSVENAQLAHRCVTLDYVLWVMDLVICADPE